MKYRAVFFDRDNTLTYFNPEKERWRDETIAAWSGKPFELPYDKMMKLFSLASEGRSPWYRNLEDEKAFFRRYYRCLLQEEGVEESLEERAEMLFRELWCNGDRLLFPETREVLEYFRGRGYKMGVISDTSPSLEYTLEQLGIAKYYDSFTASSLVGAGKPSPVIYQAALDSLGVTAEESLYVDDHPPEAEGARALGFTAFRIDRTGEDRGAWTIRSLTDLVRFAENSESYKGDRR